MFFFLFVFFDEITIHIYTVYTYIYVCVLGPPERGFPLEGISHQSELLWSLLFSSLYKVKSLILCILVADVMRL